MATVNRYTNIQPARYTPRTLQELMIAPSYMREQHNALDAGRAELETQLAQVDPLAVHSDVARQEQEKLYNEMNKQAEQLSAKGFTPTSKSDFIRLNKQYQQAISPTGTIGKINAAKEVYNKNFQDYLEDAVKNKKWSRDTAIKNWNEFESQNYTGFNEQGAVTNIGQYGAPEKIELAKKLKDVKSILGEQVVKELAAGAATFTRQPDGSLAIVNRSGRRIETSNAPNIQNAMKMMASELSDPESAWNKSIRFEGVDPVKFQEQLTGGLNAMLTSKVTDNRRTSVNFTGVKNLNDVDPGNPNIPSVTEPVKEFNNTRDNLSLNLSRIGQPMAKAIVPGYQISPTDQEVGVYTSDNIPKEAQKQYDIIYDAMQKNGMLTNNIPKYTKEANEKIQTYLDDTASFSFSNKILKPTAVDNELQKPLIFNPKKGYDMETHLSQEIESGRRHLIDKDTQQELDTTGKGYKFEYVGMVSPDNILQPNSTTKYNEDTFVLPHVVRFRDPETNVWKEAYMDRDMEELKKPEFQASKTIKQLLFTAKTAVGMNNEIANKSLENKGIKSIETKYNPNNDTYNIKFTDIYGNTTSGENLPSEQIQKQIYRLYGQKK